MLGIFSNIYVKLAIAAIVVALLGGAYWYYTSTQTKISALTEKVGGLKTTVELQKITIETMNNNIIWMQNKNDHLNAQMSRIQKESQELRKLFSKHDLEKIGAAKPNLLEKRMNEAIKKILEEFENLSNKE